MAQIKISNRQVFSEKVHQAFLRYRELCKGKESKLKANKKRALAIRAAHDCGLSYLNGETDPLIIVAMFCLASPQASEEERARALLEAWEAYERNFRTLH